MTLQSPARSPRHAPVSSRGVMLAVVLQFLAACSDAVDRSCPSGLLCPEGRQCAAKQDICIPTDCGDGVVQDDEVCDDGNVIDGDGCNRTCSSLEVCGNGVVDIARGEKCDDGNTLDGDACSADCQSSGVCGNGVRDTAVGEACDDGNNLSSDGCSADCLSKEVCGNGYTDAVKEETCDDGNTEDGDGCSADCRALEACGDGLRQGREQCDTRGESSTCNANCTVRVCGDRIVNTAAGEQCDHGNISSEMTCPYGQATCTVCREDCMAFVTAQGNVCGDNARDSAHEACDDGNTTTEAACPYGTASCQRCSANCQTALSLSGNVCGDRIQDPSGVNEVCDDGNNTTEDACPYGIRSCQVCRFDCKEVLPRTGNVCGDNDKDPVYEACDDGNTTTESACPYGSASCERCSNDCQTILSLQGNVCGDGVKDLNNANEVCDDGNALACGSCSANCKVKTLHEATGIITTLPGSNLLDGESFIISDGLNPPVVFEFDRDGSIMSENVRVPVTGGASSSQMAVIIRDAINDVAGVALAIQAAATTSSNIVYLTHQQLGSFGNQSLVEQVANSSFRVNGMSGGAGYDCQEGVRCVGDEDCAPGLTCGPSRVCTLP